MELKEGVEMYAVKARRTYIKELCRVLLQIIVNVFQ